MLNSLRYIALLNGLVHSMHAQSIFMGTLYSKLKVALIWFVAQQTQDFNEAQFAKVSAKANIKGGGAV